MNGPQQFASDLASLAAVLDPAGEPRRRLSSESALGLARAQVAMIQYRYHSGAYERREPIRLGVVLDVPALEGSDHDSH
jgi:hypothetical protein